MVMLAETLTEQGVDEHPRWQEIYQLAERCEYEAEHAHQVMRLARRLYHELEPLHRLNGNSKFYLEAAALLHDIGCLKGKRDHHKASLRFIMESSELFLTYQERLLVGGIARYHRRSMPSMGHWHLDKLDPRERTQVLILGGIVRLADALDKSHRGVVKDLNCCTHADDILVNCSVNGPLPLSQSTAADKARQLEHALDRRIWIRCVKD